MPTYRVEFLNHRVERELDQVPEPDFSRVAAALLKLENIPRPPGCLKLQGLQGWRIRVGNWRIIYRINDADAIITIVAVKRRREDTYR